MKKLILYAVFSLILLASCSSDENMLQAEISEPEMQSGGISAKRTVDEAADIAFSAIDMLPRCKSRSGARSFNKDKVKIVGAAQSRSGGSDTLMYVFNFDDEEGFAVVAADRAFSEGLIAVTEKGSYDPSVTPENPGLALYMKSAESYLTGLELKPFPIDTPNNKVVVPPINPDLMEYKIVRDTTYKVFVEPNYDLLWGQQYPEGDLFDNGLCGCTNTACLIVMSYFEAPSQINLTHVSYYATMDIDWAAIKRHRVSLDWGSSMTDECSNETHAAISKICKELATRNQSEISISPRYTGTIFSNAKYTMDALGLRPKAVASGVPSTETIATTLSNGGKILMSAKGEFYENGGQTTTARHTFVLDGIKYYSIRTGEWTRKWGEPWVCVNDHGTVNYRYNHFNWGWNGEGNGYFTLSVININSPHEYDDPNKPHGGVFSQEYMHINVFKN